MKYTLGLVALLAFPVLSAAQVNSVGPFNGLYSEGFESFGNYNLTGSINSLSIMGGFGNLQSQPNGLTTNQLWVINPGAGATWGLGGNGFAGVNSGQQALGLYYAALPSVSDVTLTFNTAVNSFGGYFAEDSTNPHFYVNLFDTNGNLLNSADIYQATNQYNWSGWSSVTDIKSVQFIGNYAPVMDDLQAQAVPEPASMGALAIGLIALIKRRRNK